MTGEDGRSIADPGCCPTGYSLVGVEPETGSKAVCLEDNPSGRAVVLTCVDDDGVWCNTLDEPQGCCPDSFTMVGWGTNGSVVCLEG